MTNSNNASTTEADKHFILHLTTGLMAAAVTVTVFFIVGIFRF